MTDTIEQLAAAFSQASRAHYLATMEGDYEVTNRQADLVHQAFVGLTAQGASGREALMQLALSGDGPIAVMAAVYSLKYDSVRALAVLTQFSKDRGVLGFQAS